MCSKISSKLGAILFILLFIISCNKDSKLDQDIFVESNNSGHTAEGAIVLGKQLSNPYSVHHMKRAMNNLLERGSIQEAIEIIPTHYYVKFSPNNEEELYQIQIAENILTYDYPLDYEIKSTGRFYRDPLTSNEIPTPQYAAVKVSQILPKNIKYEILSELFIPDDYSDKSNRIMDFNTSELLVQEALAITNNQASLGYRSANDEWRPAGKITIDDNYKHHNLQSGPIGAEVRSRRWFTTHTATIDSAGNFSCDGTFTKEAQYSIDWSRKYYVIRSDKAGVAKLMGPKSKSNWNEHIKNNTLQHFYAAIHIAAFHYYHGDVDGIRRPIMLNQQPPRVKISAMNAAGRAFMNPLSLYLGVGNDIKIYRNDLHYGDHLPITDHYSTVIHELAHYSHFYIQPAILSAELKLVESWAIGVAWKLSLKRYDYVISLQDTKLSDITKYYESVYTPLIVDLIDDYNQGVDQRELPYDPVSGYTLQQIEQVLPNCKTILDLRDELKANYNNATEQHLDLLFNQYQNLSR